MRRFARFLPFLLFGSILFFGYFILTSLDAPALRQSVTYQTLEQTGISGTRTVTKITTAYRREIRLWEAQTSVSFSYNGSQVQVTRAQHQVQTYAPGWNATYSNPRSGRNADGTFLLKDTIELWYGLTLFSKRHVFGTSAAVHEFTLRPNGSFQ